jgi:hypothetical protein
MDRYTEANRSERRRSMRAANAARLGRVANPLGDIAERTPDGTSHNGPCAERRAYSLKTYGDAEYQCTNEAGRGCRCQCHRVTISHPHRAFEPDNCPSCGTDAQIGGPR